MLLNSCLLILFSQIYWMKGTLIRLFFILIILASESQAAAPSWVPGLRSIALALGWLMMIIMGIKWLLADSPNERADAKKGMTYIIVGLLIVASACGLLCLYCRTANTSLSAAKTTTLDCTALINPYCAGYPCPST